MLLERVNVGWMSDGGRMDKHKHTLSMELTVGSARRMRYAGSLLSDDDDSGGPLFLRDSKCLWRDYGYEGTEYGEG